jgi:hypothetical protein
MDIIKSVFYDQQELLNAILELFNIEQFGLDPTYSKGVFYRNGKVPEPIIKSDINPIDKDIIKADARDLYFLDDSAVSSIIFDPPFTAGSQKQGKPGIIKTRFGYFKTIQDLWEFYYVTLKEFYRILTLDGYLIFKCQDTVDSGKNHFSHVAIANHAYKIGFKLVDLFILIAKNRILSPIKKQQHARKYHCYFWVMQK